MQKFLSLILLALLTGCSGDTVDESILAGSWVVAGDSCNGPGEKLLRYKDGNLIGNNFGVYEPFFKVFSVERKNDEVWIKFQAVLGRKPSDVAGIVFKQRGNTLIGQRMFNGRDFSTDKQAVHFLTWTRCSEDT